MLYREIIPVCSQIHTKHINTLRRQDVELLNGHYTYLNTLRRQDVELLNGHYTYLTVRIVTTGLYSSEYGAWTMQPARRMRIVTAFGSY